MTSALTILAWVLAVGCGVMAGVYFAFSSFVMASLGALAKPAGIAAMHSINRVILGSSFMPLFFGTTLLSVLAAGLGLWRWGEPSSGLLVSGGLLYVMGMFVCTAVANVPLNEALDAVDPSSAEGAQLWVEYLRRWTWWNHVRTVCSALACGVFVVAGEGEQAIVGILGTSGCR